MKPENNIVWTSCARTHTGRVRKVNQDAFVNYPDKCLWIVADGIGGHKDGGIASNAIVGAFKQFEPEKTIGASTKKIYQELDRINSVLVKQAAVAGENLVVGSTVAILYVNQQRCVVVWSGDSRIYLFRRGRLKRLTYDHNNESKLLAEGFSSEEIKVHPYAQILTHAIGGELEVYLDAQIQEIKLGDVFLLCSDGLNKEVSDSEIEHALTQMPYQQALNFLMDLSLQRGGRDNITIILAQAIS
jgi:serine/threonine protein phosphatase PrpC